MYYTALASSPGEGRMFFGDGAASHSVIASEAKQSRLHPRRDSGLLRREGLLAMTTARALRELRLHHSQPVQLHPHLVAGFQPQRLHQAAGQHELSRMQALAF